MREILFMAKDTKGEFVLGLPFGMEENEFTSYTSMMVCDSTGYWKMRNIFPHTLCEYTGVKDKEGKRIFEGHIVYHPVFGVRVITRGSLAEGGLFLNMAAFMYDMTVAFLSGSDSKDIKIIGHIYDHLEKPEITPEREE